MRIKSLFIGLTLLSFTPNLQAQQLSRAEKKLVESVDAHIAEEIAALEKVVNTDSGTFNAAGVQEVGRYFQHELEAIGFKTRWISMPEEMHRGGHLIAERAAEKVGGNRVLLMGHMDTVFEGEGHRFERTGDTVRGAGVMDMKGGEHCHPVRFEGPSRRSDARPRDCAGLPDWRRRESRCPDGCIAARNCRHGSTERCGTQF
jgi:hypothetical protein